MLHDELLMVRLDLVLPGIALQPRAHQVTVERDPGHPPAFRLPPLDRLKLPDDEAQGVRTLRHLGQVVHAGNHLHHSVRVPVWQRGLQVRLDLNLGEGKQQERVAVIFLSDVVAVFPSQVRLLVAQRPEVVRPARHQHAPHAAIPPSSAEEECEKAAA